MGLNKKMLISIGVQLLILLLCAVLVYNGQASRLNVATPDHAVYADVPQAWYVRCWSDALFIPGVLWASMGSLLWIASTGFFDLLRFGFHSLFVMFVQLRNPRELEHFYDYKVARAEKRANKGFSFAPLIVGGVALLAAFILAMIHENMIGG